ncbi:MAG TPA: hypothetical protein V6D17_24305 [Candidatus Obscuribacterales bacterium]
MSAETNQQGLSKESADNILNTTKFKAVKRKGDFPEQFHKALGLTSMSDVNGPFAAGCVGPQPHQRLIGGGISDKYFLVLSEHGGFAYFTRLSLYTRADEVRCIYQGIISRKRLEEIEKALGL